MAQKGQHLGTRTMMRILIDVQVQTMSPSKEGFPTENSIRNKATGAYSYSVMSWSISFVAVRVGSKARCSSYHSQTSFRYPPLRRRPTRWMLMERSTMKPDEYVAYYVGQGPTRSVSFSLDNVVPCMLGVNVGDACTIKHLAPYFTPV